VCIYIHVRLLSTYYSHCNTHCNAHCNALSCNTGSSTCYLLLQISIYFEYQLQVCVCVCERERACEYTYMIIYVLFITMEWLWLVGSIKLYVSFAKEPYKRDDILKKRPVILSILLTVATPCAYQSTLSINCKYICVCERECVCAYIHIFISFLITA